MSYKATTVSEVGAPGKLTTITRPKDSLLTRKYHSSWNSQQFHQLRSSRPRVTLLLL